MKKIVLAIFGISFFYFANGQVTNEDSLKTLSEVIVKAYENNRALIGVPAAMAVLTRSQLDRFNNTNILPALNTSPGIRMEERSPGSYRLSIRGSSLSSPFGVRNVKIYYNGIPFTDPGGNTYLNQLGFYNVQSVEVIKEPGSSLYGAGTGGVVLISGQPAHFYPGASVNLGMGSFNTQNINTGFRFGNEDHQNMINYQHQTSDGYRSWTKMRRDIISYDAGIKTNEHSDLSAHFLYGDLFYQTPGALTKTEYNADPKASRPPVGATPGAVQAQAAIYQKMFLAGLNYTQLINSNIKNTTVIYGAYSNITNPTFRNYEIRSEPHFGGRTVFQLAAQLPRAKINFDLGAEFQKSFNRQTDYGNRLGNPDTLQTDDLINNLQEFVFSQITLELPKGWLFTAGASLNKADLDFKRLSKLPVVGQTRNYNNELAPRIAILKRLSDISVFASISRGFSPPTTADILPSTGVFNMQLQAEHGINYEIGTRGDLFNTRFYFDIDAFFFQLKNGIVQRQDATGADYFVNAGSTSQNGVEAYLSYQLAKNNSKVFTSARLWLSYSWQNFHYKDFKQVNTDYSGKQLPGISPNTIYLGADINLRMGMYINLTYNYTDKIALNDANTDLASSYNLLTARMGYRNSISKKINIDLFAGIENILDERYSLGNDINASAGRYYNLAPGRNYFAGISFSFDKK